MNISACIIVKNEENFLEDCLKSLVNIAWEIIVLDTGSTDKTVEIAKKYAKVFHYQWNGNSSDARNKSISYANGEWILILDADERLSPYVQKNLNHYLDSQIIKENTVLMFNHINMNPYSVDKSYFKATMFKNNQNIKYIGFTHEFPYSETEQLQLIFLDNFQVIHLNGNSKDELISKANKYISLISEQVKKEPESYQNHYFYKQLSNDYFLIEDYQKALENFYRSIKTIVKHNKLKQDKEFCLNLSSKIIRDFIRLKQDFKKATEISNFILGLFAGLVNIEEILEIKYYMAYSLFYHGEYQNSLEIYLELDDYFQKTENIDTNIIFSVYLGIARCYLLDKNFTLSFVYFSKAQKVNKVELGLILLHMTRYYLLNNEYENALDNYQKILKNNINYSHNELKIELLKYNIWSDPESEQLKNIYSDN